MTDTLMYLSIGGLLLAAFFFGRAFWRMFIKKRWGNGLLNILYSIIAVTVALSLVGIAGTQMDKDAIELGFIDSSDQALASKNGYTDPEEWSLHRADILAEIREQERAEAEEAARKAEVMANIERLQKFNEVCQSTRVTQKIYRDAEDRVRSDLKSPSTADFAGYFGTDFSMTKPDDIGASTYCFVKLESYVDAQNGFGATIRQNFFATYKVNADSGTWAFVEWSFY